MVHEAIREANALPHRIPTRGLNDACTTPRPETRVAHMRLARTLTG